jgi:hypothetical protein
MKMNMKEWDRNDVREEREGMKRQGERKGSEKENLRLFSNLN